ncbi:MAG: hypothetical protein EOP10_33560 [Proteobacteria bacterium]|nr:MAG: hypothetical protein EOP10_33560 [Pseudomonadota bacterium]
MRRPLVLAVLLSVALFAVIYGKYRLDKMIQEGKMDATEASPPSGEQQNTIDIGVQADPGQESLAVAPPHGTGSAHQDVMAALVDARQTFRNKETVTKEAAANPHTTPALSLNLQKSSDPSLPLKRCIPSISLSFRLSISIAPKTRP